jgi:hypothetical protein
MSPTSFNRDGEILPPLGAWDEDGDSLPDGKFPVAISRFTKVNKHKIIVYKR